ncbi:MAG: cytochrome c oxidase subunit II, partial [Caulobacteraceae bacterium]
APARAPPAAQAGALAGGPPLSAQAKAAAASRVLPPRVGPPAAEPGRWPMNYLRTAGPRADPVTALTWGLIALSLTVIAAVTIAVAAGVMVRKSSLAAADLPEAPVGRAAGGLAWFYVGMPLTVLALIGALIWTLAALAAVDSPATRPALTLTVTGHQWWWGVRYAGARPGEGFDTANEIPVPVGPPVLIHLVGADVIHSFWVPALTGKTDTIPGRANIAWLQADRAGVYRGQCTEYCGLQHAHMAVYVIAQPPSDFEAWRQGQLEAAAPPADGEQTIGEGVLASRCGACHTVRGTPAHGVKGPDLTHLMSRRTIAAGALDNTVANLSGWISDPQALKPGAKMPATWLSGPQLAALRAYLETLK